MLIIDMIGIVIATALMFWSMNYSVVAHFSDDEKQSKNYYILSASLLVVSVILFAFVGGHSGGI
jgi:uncharacterized membrane protein